MDESSFSSLADKFLESVADVVDEALGDDIEVDYHGGILTLSLDGGGQYVINKHAPNREIWWSSPVSGAIHFAPVDGAWVSTRDKNVVLADLLSAELKAKYDVSLTF